MTDIDYLAGILTELDIEGLVIESAFLLDYLKRMDKSSLNSEDYRTAQLAYSFFAPLMEIAGFDMFSSELRSEALLYFYRESEYYDRAMEIYQAAQSEMEGLNEFLCPIIFEVFGIDNDPKILGRLHDFYLYESPRLSIRLKTLGSILKKLIDTADQFSQGDHVNCPDTIGFRILLQDDETSIWRDIYNQFITIINRIIEGEASGYSNEIRLGHIRGGAEPAIELAFKEILSIENPHNSVCINNTNYLIKLRPNRESGYQDGRFCLIITTTTDSGKQIETGVEVQATTPQAHAINNTQAHHVLYKASTDAFGPLAYHSRKMEEIMESDPKQATDLEKEIQSHRSKVIEQIKSIQARTLIFVNRLTNESLKLTSTSLWAIGEKLGIRSIPNDIQAQLLPQADQSS